MDFSRSFPLVQLAFWKMIWKVVRLTAISSLNAFLYLCGKLSIAFIVNYCAKGETFILQTTQFKFICSRKCTQKFTNDSSSLGEVWMNFSMATLRHNQSCTGADDDWAIRGGRHLLRVCLPAAIKIGCFQRYSEREAKSICGNEAKRKFKNNFEARQAATRFINLAVIMFAVSNIFLDNTNCFRAPAKVCLHFKRYFETFRYRFLIKSRQALCWHPKSVGLILRAYSRPNICNGVRACLSSIRVKFCEILCWNTITWLIINT